MGQETNASALKIFIEKTPNPQSMKFRISRPIAEESWSVQNTEQAKRSPLAQKIMGFPWAREVFIGQDFITIAKEDWVEWDIITQPLAALIQNHITEGQTVLYPPPPPSHSSSSDPSSVAEKIKALLEKDIQPAVNLDGGFIAFAGYEKGVVFLKMQGACSGCPSASLTLKQGIENHLKNHISEVKQVVAL